MHTFMSPEESVHALALYHTLGHWLIHQLPIFPFAPQFFNFKNCMSISIAFVSMKEYKVQVGQDE